ncbi:insulin-like growth factor-binding protein complex acid labile subunit [Euwallacea fornicatus]|uniref:insulin-like growth factor-binding protein complex acid labile subunit n=1 Tax=Euwallacea fornicatus TaxID=995702 RepID=UPI00338F6514
MRFPPCWDNESVFKVRNQYSFFWKSTKTSSQLNGKERTGDVRIFKAASLAYLAAPQALDCLFRLKRKILIRSVQFFFLLQISSQDEAVLTPVCKYGYRGSLTAVCINATANLFRETPYRFDHLDETLVCVTCNLSNITRGTFDINGNRIKALVLENSNIKTIAVSAFTGLVFMEELHLTNNSIFHVDPGAFHGTRKVKQIFLDRALTGPLPDMVFQDLVLLRELYLNNNDLKMLNKDTFYGLANLENLDLSNNKLSELNGSVANLGQLKFLTLSNNLLTMITRTELTGLKSLVTLDLSMNSLYFFNINIGPPNSLRMLNLSRNMLGYSILKEGQFNDLKNLENLDLSRNSLTSVFPKLFIGLFNLRELQLAENNITKFPLGVFSGLPSLKLINVSNNRIESAIISGRQILPQVHTIDFSYNALQEFDFVGFLRRLPSISKVWLSGNNLDCKESRRIEQYFKQENILYRLDFHIKCPALSQSELKHVDGDLEKEFSRYGKSSSTLIALKVTLVILISVFVGVLFYVQFFILNRKLK